MKTFSFSSQDLRSKTNQEVINEIKPTLKRINMSFRSASSGDVIKGIHYVTTNEMYNKIEEVLKEHDIFTCFLHYPFNNEYTTPNKFKTA